MPVLIKTITTVTCDICIRECGINDNVIKINVNGGDGRDVGPATIYGELKFNQPYGVSGGIICNQCKMNWLDYYVKNMKKEIEFNFKKVDKKGFNDNVF
jgi:hypothetical protein